jgi:hypothetical protein
MENTELLQEILKEIYCVQGMLGLIMAVIIAKAIFGR